MLTTSQKKYLLTIYLLGQNGNKVRITDVASFLGVAKASTVRMMDKLIEEGYISKEPYKLIGLTKKRHLRGEQDVHRKRDIAGFFHV